MVRRTRLGSTGDNKLHIGSGSPYLSLAASHQGTMIAAGTELKHAQAAVVIWYEDCSWELNNRIAAQMIQGLQISDCTSFPVCREPQ